MGGYKHTSVGDVLTKTEWEADDSHSIRAGTSFPASPSDGDEFYRTDDHVLYLYDSGSSEWRAQGGKEVKSERAIVNTEMTMPHFSSRTNLPSGLSAQYSLAMVDDTEQIHYTINNGTSWTAVGERDIVGIEWNITQDSWSQVDLEGNTISLTSSDFNSIYPWAGITRVNLSTAGEINAWYGGDNFSEDGTNGRVMARIPKFFVKSETKVESGDTKVTTWISPENMSGFEVHPAFNQRTNNPPAEEIFIGAYEGDFTYDSSGSHYEFHSRSSKQPWTGGQIWEVDFDDGQNEPTIGNQVSTTADTGWYLADYDKTGGTWGGTTAATGSLWVRKPGDDTLGWSDNEKIANDTQSNTIATCEFTGGAKTSLHLDIEESQTYSSNIGSNWGLTNVWSLWAMQLLFGVEYGNLDSQTELGSGIVDKGGGTGFNGELTATDSINSNLDSALTGTGNGTDGLTPITYRGVENLWGNIWTFIDGYEAVDSEYRILKPEGGWSNSGPGSWTSSDYETSDSSPLKDDDGYISSIETERLLKYGFIPSATSGSNSSYIPDKFWSHDSGENNILLAGGCWFNGSDAGVGCLYSAHGVGNSNRTFGGRLEFIK